uniref:Putative secreted protein n=1 Tax=Anopheles darlingi TaxID=43151 RepID=A0A2M4D7W0_ANODA
MCCSSSARLTRLSSLIFAFPATSYAAGGDNDYGVFVFGCASRPVRSCGVLSTTDNDQPVSQREGGSSRRTTPGRRQRRIPRGKQQLFSTRSVVLVFRMP